MQRVQTTRFLNVDLELRSAIDLGALLAALEPGAIILRHDPGALAILELGAVEPGSIDEVVTAYWALVDALPTAARVLWERCERRTLNVGIQAGFWPHAAEFCLSQASLRLVDAMRADVVFTVYAAPPG